MLRYVLQGFMLGLAYVAPIGMQNLYVINSAISQERIKAYQVALITIFFDISLALTCFFGMGLIMEKSQILRGAILLIGSLVVIYIGIGLIKSKPEELEEVNVNKTLMQVVIACFTVTWMNPQALIDGSLLFGGFRASLPTDASSMFIIGVCLASFSWFMGITTIVSMFRNAINAKVLHWINIICGAVIIYYGGKLLYTFIQMVI
ncbi:LysE/ArgO family amino acid transporter [Inediibacterium massiliense]|uniref:LysE/ArgO family amino acid transporter n=1 Tax=Inediibacterium massiliense TaxID=1658111 RepID=UPI0006B529E7|nr:LysE family transporter [Inediibacterium massiliense]